MSAITSSQASPADRLGGLDPETLIRAFRIMHLSRRLDDREITLKRQNRIFFQISGAGHEAVQVAAALALRPGQDWIYPYYRDRALCLALGVTAAEMLLAAVGAAADPALGIAEIAYRHLIFADRHAICAGCRLRRGVPLPGQELGHHHSGHFR